MQVRPHPPIALVRRDVDLERLQSCNRTSQCGMVSLINRFVDYVSLPPRCSRERGDGTSFFYLITKNEPSQSKVHHSEQDDERSDDRIAEHDREDQHVTGDLSRITKVTREPCLFNFRLSLAQILLLQVKGDERNNPR